LLISFWDGLPLSSSGPFAAGNSFFCFGSFFSQEELICLPGTVGSVTVEKKAQTKQNFLFNDKSIGCGQFLINRTQSHIKERLR
jgi:hypothetical protein